MMKIVFLGYLTSPETAINSVAGNKMQWNVVGQLANLSDINLSCVSVTPMMSFPHSKIIHHQKTSEMLFSNVKNQRVAFWNLPVLKQFSTAPTVL